MQSPLPWSARWHLRAPEPAAAHTAGGMARRPGEAANGRLREKAGPSPPGLPPSRAALEDSRFEIARRQRRQQCQGLPRPKGGRDPGGPHAPEGL
ncbi:hypothetical protein PAL_GLEAN10015164 [Pteropus alecto]|uniref:Uncharacterized protein n=1 Tax=Pteropus alecto TaxID=9402 RepID=L5JUI5_PTEAL|nr:hypothetical protein PAL_GLEAN10015164 [Pteropus alecto]